MYIPPIHPRPDDAPLLRCFKHVAREAFHLPVRLRMEMAQDLPWLVDGAIAEIENFLRPRMRVFEWGGGRSTVFFARRCARVTTIEHKAKWHKRIAARIAELDAPNVDLRLVPPDENAAASHAGRQRPEFAAYADAVLEFPENAFDIVCIDGRARVDCARNALPRLVPGGMLVLDNSEWPKYAPIREMTRGWPARRFANGVWETTIMRKPVS